MVSSFINAEHDRSWNAKQETSTALQVETGPMHTIEGSVKMSLYQVADTGINERKLMSGSSSSQWTIH